MRIAVLGGAGKMGKGIVRDLVSKESKDIKKVVIADVSVERAKGIVEELRDRRLEAVHLDISDKEKTIDLLKRVDVCVNTVPIYVRLQMDIFHYCLDAKCPYLDLGGLGMYTPLQKEEHETWVKEGVAAILSMGSAPGITNVLCKAVAEHLDVIDKINLYWAGKTVDPESPVFVPPYNVLTLLAEYGCNSKQFINGKLVEMPPQSGKQTLVLEEPFGKTEFIHSMHSETSTVPFAREIKGKGIKEFTWRLHLPEEKHKIMKTLMEVGFGDFEQPIKMKGVEIKPGEFLEALIDRNVDKNKDMIPEVTVYDIYFAIGEGEKSGKKAKVTGTLYANPDPFFDGYIDAATSMSASIGAQILGRGEIPPGAWGPEECLDVEQFLAELKKRHFRVTMKIEEEM